MSPSAIAAELKEQNFKIAALTDHNSALNCAAFEKCCRALDIIPVSGIEVTTIEEAHIVCLFDNSDKAEELGRLIYSKLPDVHNKAEKFGDQVAVDEHENIIAEVDKYLLSAAEISLDELFDEVSGLGGLFIPAHINRPVFSIPSQLGFLPDMEYSAVEVTKLPCDIDLKNYTIIANSDAHYPHNIGNRYSIYADDDISFEGLKNSMKKGSVSTIIQSGV